MIALPALPLQYSPYYNQQTPPGARAFALPKKGEEGAETRELHCLTIFLLAGLSFINPPSLVFISHQHFLCINMFCMTSRLSLPHTHFLYNKEHAGAEPGQAQPQLELGFVSAVSFIRGGGQSIETMNVYPF